MTERNTSIDISKGIAIYAVVIGHVIAWFFKDFNAANLPYEVSVLWKTIYSFHMPFFIFLSGYVFMNPAKKYSTKYMFKRIVSYLIPFVTMGFLLYYWRGGRLDNYWYFRTLAEFSLIMYLLVFIISKISNRYFPIISFLLFVCFMKLCQKIISENGILAAALDTSHFYLCIYFGLGYLFRIYNSCIEKLLINQYVMFMSMLFIFFCIVTGFNQQPIIKSTIMIVFFINLSHVLANLFTCKHLNNVGQHTLGVYIIHFFFTFKIYDIGNWIFNISLQGGITSSLIIQMCIALPISMFIVKASILIEKILREIPFFSFVLLGNLNFISTNTHNYRTLIVKKIWRKK